MSAAYPEHLGHSPRPPFRGTAMNMPNIDLNWLAVITAAVSAFVLGGLWYGPLFKRAWCRETGIDPDSAPAHPGAYLRHCLRLQPAVRADLRRVAAAHAHGCAGLGLGFVIGLFFVAMSFGINYAFAQRSVKLWMIDAGYHIAQFSLYGLILGAWH